MEKKILKTNSELILNLIKLYIPQEYINNYLNYFHRILSSKLSANSNYDNKQILNLLSRRVSSKRHEKISFLVSKLEENSNLKKTKEILLILFKLSEERNELFCGNLIPNVKIELPVSKSVTLEVIDSKPKPSIESTLIRDVLFTFQGLEGKYLNFSYLDDRFIIRHDIPDYMKSAIENLTEIGWLYKKITKFISNYEFYPSIVCQNFCGALKVELKEYYRLIALLEGQSNSKLKLIELWCDEPLERMRWLAIICEAVEGLKGGNFISAIFSYSKYGNPAIKVLVNRILDSVSEQFLKIIENWMLEGELFDNFNEFFVKENLEIAEDKLWTIKYTLIKDLVPEFMPPELVDQIFLTGKSINFIRKCCLEEWKSEGPLELPKLRDLPSMKIWIETTSSVTNKKLIGILFTKYRFVEHANCIRKYLLLAQGDFHHYLMEQLNDVLNEPAKKIHKHNLVSILENAIRASNAQNDDLELLNKLSIRLDEYNPFDNGWDVFALKYQVESPLNSIFSEQVMAQYSKIFKLFWRIKRVFFYMNSYQNERVMIELQNMWDIKYVLHKCQMLRLEILHFVNNLCHYLMVEVQEGAWNHFMKSLHSLEDFDKLIKSHQHFLDIILERAFLTPENERIYKKLLKLLELSLRFKSSQETLINSAIDEFQRRKSENLKVEERSRLHSLCRISTESIRDIDIISLNFCEEIQSFRRMLADADKTHLRFLSFRLDFNEYYSNKNPNRFTI